MPSLDDLKKRIKSVKSTQKITKAMKMVAAAKLRKAQENAEKGRPYSQKMQNIILNLTKSNNDPQNAPKLLVGTGEDKKYLCVVLTADRGLCGGFNSNIVKKAKIFFGKDQIILPDVDKKAYLSALKISDHIIVTCDSTAMISEAAITGKPIYVAQMPAVKNDQRF